MLRLLIRLSALIYIALILGIGLAIAIGQQNPISPILVVTTVPEESRMREIVLLDVQTGVRYRLLQQFNIENVAFNPLDQSFVIQQRSALALSAISIAPLQYLTMEHNGEDGLSNPEWSPDGQSIAYSGHDFRQDGIFISDAQGQNLQTLTMNAAFARRFLWSPDAQSIVYVERDEQQYNLRQIQVSSGKDDILLSRENYILLVGWQENDLLFLHNETLMQYQMNSARIIAEQAIRDFTTLIDSRWSQYGQTLLLLQDEGRQLSLVNDEGNLLYQLVLSDRRIISVNWWQR
jgi:dipeptidyl aminopeptidase/acylaminoacyl peptidase